MLAYRFTTEKEAEEFCTRGYPKKGKDLQGNVVEGKGETLRAADWSVGPDGAFYVAHGDVFDDGRAEKPVETGAAEGPAPKAAGPDMSAFVSRSR